VLGVINVRHQWIATTLQLAVGQLDWNDFSVTLKQSD
jgi:hypothetical protein